MGFWADDNNSPIDRQTTFAKWIPRGQYISIQLFLYFLALSLSLKVSIYFVAMKKKKRGGETSFDLIAFDAPASRFTGQY